MAAFGRWKTRASSRKEVSTLPAKPSHVCCSLPKLPTDDHRDVAEKIPVVLPGRIPLSLPSPSPPTHTCTYMCTHIYYHNSFLCSVSTLLPLFSVTLSTLTVSTTFFPGVLYSYLVKVWDILLAKEHFEHSYYTGFVVEWRNWKLTIETLPFIMSNVQ